MSHADSADAKYPHDRVVFFSDAVFAIAITLLAVEIKVPGHAQVEAAGGILAALQGMLPLFIGFAVSFLVTALFWKSHLQLCRHIRQFDDRLIWLNVLQLLLIGLLPFSTALYSDYFGSHQAFAVYCAHLAAIGAAALLMHAYAVRKEGLVQRLGALQARAMTLRVAIAPVVFALCIPLAMVAPVLGRLGFVAVFVLQWVVMRVYRRRILLQAAAAT
ncbi:TMEM175 family protein [Xanthomonas sp. NCPPB 2654]|uniref:TMEM175 family protein n=1 Tax=unclassified Xanthomonas TaxID=2643310 RepID=UPI0021DF7998|nr:MULTISPECIES: TMEM175 family protein [unclassified Xanthomonas]MDL5368055.1 TMEM175 family protein [Xanthomonas sp. NCPPB 2654]UYC22340.1 TMEM175 family protein [Xanthomonas sp. CFBP 8443]